MWEAIAGNKRRSVVLVSLMGVLLVGLGAVVGWAIEPQGGGAVGALAAVGLWLLLWLIAGLSGDNILLMTAGARRIEKSEAPQLWNVVEEMTIAAGLAKMPEVYVIHDGMPNAFATGRSPDKSAVAVTTGLLKRLNRDELQGVIAHEIGHVLNRDVAFMALAGVMLGAIVLIAEVFRRSLWFGGGRRRSSRGGGQAQLLIIVVALLVAILAPLLARLLYLACSRRREYLADATSARLTRYPEGLASALEKISAGAALSSQNVSRVLAPMYIVNPMEALALTGLFSTHPATEERIRILRSMAGGADYARYEEAYRRVKGKSVLGARTLRESRPVEARAPSVEKEGHEQIVERLRDVAGLAGRLDDLVQFTCACGVGIRVPASYRRDTVRCPRCGQQSPVPRLHDEASAAAPQAPLSYRRQGRRWESFECACGRVVQLSPQFRAPRVTCGSCGRSIDIEG